MGLLDDLLAARRGDKAQAATPAPAGHTEPALLFIPDISGFTQFIHDLGNQQGPWLIADLLEILIEANILGMAVSEIQGDAILFYRLGPPPPVQELVAQCRRLFLDFQNYVQLVERDTNSSLGKALRHHDLTLKIVVHYGQVSVAQIREFTKLMGRDVIVVHRLLKNNVMSSEYVLLSDEYLDTQPPADVARSFSWTRLLRGECHYDHLGKVCYGYAHLTPLRQQLDENERPGTSSAGLQNNALKVRRVVHLSAQNTLRVVSNFRLRPRWMAGATGVHYDVTKAGRLGTSYKVDINQGQIDFQAVQRFVGNPDRLEYVEKISHFRIFPNSLLFFFIEAVDDHSCLVTLEFRYGQVASPHPLIRFGQLQRLYRFLGRSIHQLAELGLKVQL